MSRSAEVQASDIGHDYEHRLTVLLLETGAQSVTDLMQKHQTGQHLVVREISPPCTS